MPRLLATHSPLIPFLLVVLQIACWAEMDLFVPSLPEMMHHFQVNEQLIQLVFSLNFLGFFVSSLFIGPLADAFGRRPTLIWGSALFVVGGLMAVLAPNIYVFLLARLIQGLGVSAPAVVSVAVVCDMFEGEKQVRILSVINSIITITMALAPIVGSFVATHLGWQANFAVIAALAVVGLLIVVFFVPETLAQEHRRALKMSDFIGNYGRLLTSPHFLLPAMGVCVLVTPYFVYIGIIPLLFVEHMKMPMGEYVLYQSAVVGTFSVCSLLVPQATKIFNIEKLTRNSFILSIVAATALAVHGMFFPDYPLSITLFMCAYAASLVMACTVMFVKAMDAYADLRASASSLLQSMRMLMLAGGTSLSGYLYNETYAPVGFQTVLWVLVGVACCWPFIRSDKNKPTTSAIAFH